MFCNTTTLVRFFSPPVATGSVQEELFDDFGFGVHVNAWGLDGVPGSQGELSQAQWLEVLVWLQDGAPKIAKLPYKWLNSMVYGRYNYS